MSATFAANLLRTGASGYAGVAASMLLERQSDLEDRFGPDALSRWKDNLQQRLLELASALDAGSADAFAARMRWTAVAFDVRGIDGADLQAGLDCLADALRENLPPFAVEPFTWIPGIVWFALKIAVLLFVFIWVRGTMPRFRYDQLMRLGWKIFLPFSLLWVVLTAGAVVAFDWLPA